MPDEQDSTDFVDKEYLEAKSSGGAISYGPPSGQPPSRAELEARAADVQQEIEKLRRAQEELERKRAALEETRRRRIEWETSRKELIHGITRALGLLEEAEFSRRQEAEQMKKTIAGLREAISKVQAIQEESWTNENFEIELTRALTIIENARQEWNSARLKYPFLDNPSASAEEDRKGKPILHHGINIPDFWQLFKIGLAINLPIVIILLIAVIAILLKR